MGVMCPIMETYVSGRGGKWFGPGQPWDENRLIYEVNRDLPDVFGITSNWAKAVFGAVVVGGFYAIGGFLAHALFRRYNARSYRRISLLQYSLMMFFLLSMSALPIKILLPHLFPVKYRSIT